MDVAKLHAVCKASICLRRKSSWTVNDCQSYSTRTHDPTCNSTAFARFGKCRALPLVHAHKPTCNGTARPGFGKCRALPLMHAHNPTCNRTAFVGNGQCRPLPFCRCKRARHGGHRHKLKIKPCTARVCAHQIACGTLG